MKKYKKSIQHKTTLLYTAVSIALMGVSPSSYAADEPNYQKIGDLEIYQRPSGGSVNVTMMLDTSGSMRLGEKGKHGVTFDTVLLDYGHDCVHTTDRSQTFTKTIAFTDAEGVPVPDQPSYTLNLKGCKINGVEYYGRIDRLKKALVELLADGTRLPPDYKIGMGNYPSYGLAQGSIKVPSAPLTVEHRKRLIEYVLSLNAQGNTPTAQAYAEVGAYMMGTKTAGFISDTKKKFVVPIAIAKRKDGTGQFRFNSCRIFDLNFNQPVVDKQGYTWLGCTVPDNDVLRVYPVAGNEREKLLNYTFPDGFDQLNSYNTTIVKDARGRETTITDTFNTPTSVVYGIQAHSYVPSTAYSGFMFSHDDTKKPDQQSYQSPVTQSECGGDGIYFLTDGYPNDAVKKGQVANLMATSLNRNDFRPDNSLLPKEGAENEISQGGRILQASGWEYIGPYAQALKDPTNPSGVEINTAVLGFGSLFTNNVDPATGKIADCNALPNTDTKNSCKLGQEIGGGGFTATSDPDIVAKSIVEFAASLNKTVPSLPAGTISIPSDPLSADRIQPYAYLPMIQPQVAKSDSIWGGNLKKYNTLYGTLYGKDGTRLYKTSSNPTKGNEAFASTINTNAKDLWQTEARLDNSAIEVGGSRETLRQSTNNKTSRVVYVESKNNNPSLIKVQIVDGVPRVLANRQTGGFEKLLQAGYSFEEILYLTDYLGFALSKDVGFYGANDTARLTKLAGEIQKIERRPELVFGGVNHSVPVLAAYKAEFDESGNATTDESKRTDYMLYGSMDGALHMTKVKDGTEAFSFIPRAIFDNQKEALIYGSKAGGVGQPFFGVDAPWDTLAKYRYEEVNGNEGVVAEKMYAYGGLRMGGIGFYGLDITQEDAPSLLFSINDKKAGFERLGQTWAKPTKARIKTGPQASDYKDVLIFGGGYDMCYENPKFKLNDANNSDPACQNKTVTKGNAIYMVDASNGTLLKSWAGPSPTTTTAGGGFNSASDDTQYMNHSFVSEIVPLDRNNNGYVDSLYAADLGGQLFRIDLKEGASSNEVSRRIVRVFDANKSLATDNIPYRFYEKPAVSFYSHQGGTLAMVNIASGDRSSPIHKHRDSKEKANRIYGIIDRDLTTNKILSNTQLSNFSSRNLDNDHLLAYDTEQLRTMSDAQRKSLMDSLKTGGKQGWYYDMTRFEDFTDVKNLKAVGSSIVTGNIYYTSIYSPDYQYTKGSSCSAKVLGATERQGFCLPWGICASNEGELIDGSTNGTLGYIKAGPGIQELALTTLTGTAGKSSNFKTFVSPNTMLERTQISSTNTGENPVAPTDIGNGFNGKVGRGQDHNRLYADAVTSDNRILKIDRWYDLANVEVN